MFKKLFVIFSVLTILMNFVPVANADYLSDQYNALIQNRWENLPTPAPTGLEIKPVDGNHNRVQLKWNETPDKISFPSGFQFRYLIEQARNTTRGSEIFRGVISKTFSENGQGKLLYETNVEQDSFYIFTVYQIRGTGDKNKSVGASVLYSTAPNAPSFLTAKSSETKANAVELSWQDNSQSEGRFEIEKTWQEGTTAKNGTLPISANTTKYTDSNIQANISYTYTVRAVSQTGQLYSEYSKPATIMALNTPTDLTAASGPTCVLTWKCLPNPEALFCIERKAAFDSTFATIATVKSSQTSYRDTPPLKTTYSYRVKAIAKNNLSSWYSNTVDWKPSAPGLYNFTATAASHNQVNLSWSNSLAGKISFIITRIAPNGKKVINLPANQSSYVDKGLTPNTKYTYTIRAFSNLTKKNIQTLTATATTLPTPNTLDANNANAKISQISLTAKVSGIKDNTFELSWENTGNKSIIIEKSWGKNSAYNSQKIPIGSNVSNHIDNDIKPEIPYTYQLKTIETKPLFSNKVTVILLRTPTGLTTKTDDNNKCRLTWNDVSTNETGYIIERKSSSSSDYVKVTTLPANTSEYTDAPLSGSSYYYRVKAIGKDTFSSYSDTASWQAPNSPLANFKVTNQSSSGSLSVLLTWTSVDDTSMYIMITRSGPGGTKVFSAPANRSSYEDKLTESGTYTYTVQVFKPQLNIQIGEPVTKTVIVY